MVVWESRKNLSSNRVQEKKKTGCYVLKQEKEKKKASLAPFVRSGIWPLLSFSFISSYHENEPVSRHRLWNTGPWFSLRHISKTSNVNPPPRTRSYLQLDDLAGPRDCVVSKLGENMLNSFDLRSSPPPIRGRSMSLESINLYVSHVPAACMIVELVLKFS